ncbi:MAG: hypothetical protein K0S39_1827, partial [Paenibacillus sp.]|nr:hypothetical protein [Paenibacillus sp.]
PYVNPALVKVTLEPGPNTRTFSLEKETFGNLEGTVTDPGGNLAAGIRVVLTDPQGRSLKETITDEQGRYAFRTNARTYTVHAERTVPPLLSTEKPVSVQMLPGQTVTSNIQVISRGSGRIELDARMKPVDGDWQRIEIPDWRSVVHYGLNVKGVNQSFLYKTMEVNDNLLPVVAAPGDQATVCMNGTEAGLKSACDEVTLDEYRNGIAELRLEEKARITGRIIGESSYSGFQAYARRINGQQSGYHRGVRVDSTGRFSISLPESGKVELSIQVHSWPNDYSRRNYSQTVEVADGQLLELADIRMPDLELFYGQPDNGLNVREMTAAPEDTVTVRGSYKLPNTNRTSLEGGYLGIEVPAGAGLVPQSIMVQGVPVEPEAGAGINGVIKVPVGKITANALVTFSYRLKLDSNVENDVLAKIHIGYNDTQGTKQELLGSAWIRVQKLTLEAPQRAIDRTINVSGLAPAGRTVAVYAEGSLVGHAQATPGGLWYTRVTLPAKTAAGVWNKGTAAYSLMAQAETEEGAVSSNPVTVSVNSGYSMITNITMRQSEGSRVSINPAEGIARFPFVIVPSLPMFFELESNAPEQIMNVKVKLGQTEASAVYNKTDGKFYAMMPVSSSVGTGLYVTYDEKPKPYERSPLPTEEDWKAERANMPDIWRTAEYELMAAGTGEDPFTEAAALNDDGFVHSPTVKIKFNLDNSTEYGYYRISAKAAGSSGSSGKTFRDVKVRVNESAGIIEMEGTVPVSLLSGGAGAAVKALLGPAAAAETGGITVKSTLRVGSALNNLRKYVTDGWDFAKYADQLIDFQDYVIATECHTPAVNAYLRATERLFDQAKTNLIIKNATTGLALVAGTLTLVIPPVGGVVIAGILTVMGEMAKSSWEEELEALKAEFEKEKQWRDDMAEAGAIERCDDNDDDDDDDIDDIDDKKHRPDKDKVADPTWIWDPSGYVYETFPENRIEGVTATILKKNEENGAWEMWDSEWFGQKNPLTSDKQGRYGWDVPEGKWQVLYEKDGYLPARSAELTVLPPHLDVNIPMVSLEPPRVSVVDAVYGAGVRVMFSKYMRADSLTSDAIVMETAGGDRIRGTVEAVGARMDADNKLLSKQFRFIPGDPVTAGSEYKITVPGWVNSYARVSMEQDFTAMVQMKPDEALAAEAAGSLKAAAGQKQLAVEWVRNDHFDLDKFKLYWRVKNSGAAYEGPVEIDADREGYLLGGLLPGTEYELKLTTAGAGSPEESAGITAEGTTLQEEAFIVDTTPAGEVAQAAVQPEKTAVTVSWTDPGDADLRNVLVSWKKQTADRYGKPVYVEPGAGQLRIDGLDPSTGYLVRLVTADRIWNLSDGITLEARTTGTDPDPDRTPPQEVGSAAVRNITADGFTASWTDPVDADLKDIRISLKKQAEGEAYGPETTVTKGTSQFSFTGLQANTGYQIQLVAVDQSGNRSSGIVLEARTAIKSESRGRSRGGGGVIVAPDPALEQESGVKVELAAGAGEWSGFEQRISLKYTDGTFVNGGRLVILNAGAVQPPSDYEAYSDAFRLQLESGTLSKPMKLTLKYDPIKHRDFDARQLGLYRQDDLNPDNWLYVGGILNSGESAVTAEAAQTGTYVLMTYSRGFADLHGHWSKRDVQVLISRHMIDGMTEAAFEPDQAMTRAQFTKLLTELTIKPGSREQPLQLTEAPFRDVAQSAWHAPYIALAKKNGLVEGSDGMFRPDDVLTRQEMAVLIARALGLESQGQLEVRTGADSDGTAPAFTDGGAIAPWAAGHVEAVRMNGLMEGIGEGRFEPEWTASRAQGAVLILRAMARLGLLGN